MKKAALAISKTTQRLFVLGKQRLSGMQQIEFAPAIPKEVTEIISSGQPAQL